ncbi:Gamma-aminobutyric acid type B receptor subunit 1, partial [Lamellibrachia satsuma]
MKILFDQIHRPPVKLMLLGPALSSVAIAVAQASRNWNLIQFSFSARSSELSNRDRFPFFFRTLPADTSFNPVRIAMFQHFGWTRIATLHENTHASTYSSSTYDLLARLKRLNFTVVASESFRGDPSIAMDNLKNRDARIIVASFYVNTALKVFCEAYKRKMYGGKYVWILLEAVLHVSQMLSCGAKRTPSGAKPT